MWAARWTGWKVIAVAAFVALGAGVAMTPRELDPWERHVAAMEAKLEAAWRARHPGPPLPERCEVLDEPYANRLEVDRTSEGQELVVSNHRLGIALFAASGELIAFADSRGCPSQPLDTWFNTVLLGGTPEFDGLVMREEGGECRFTSIATLYRRKGDTLVQQARYFERLVDQCDNNVEVVRWVTDVQETPRGLKIGFKQRNGGDFTDHDCSLGFDRWMTPSCRPLLD